MASTYTTNKQLEKPANGDYVNTWNVPVNSDMDVIDQALGGVTYLNATAGSATLTATQYRSMMLSVSGAMAADVTYTVPATVGGMWIVNNLTSGNYTLYIRSGTSTPVSLPRGQATIVFSTGSAIITAAALSSDAPTGGGSDRVFYLNDTTVNTSYTIPSGKNAGSFGPITVSPSATVTVPAGSNWTIV